MVRWMSLSAFCVLMSYDTLAGIATRSGSSDVVSMPERRVLVRADLLVQPGHIERTAFQMEYLPSGTRCTGTVTRAESFGFDAVCRLPNGARRFVRAQWQGTGSNRIAGTVSARP